MATLKFNNYNLFSQSSTNRPEFAIGNNFPVIGEQSSFTATFQYFTDTYTNTGTIATIDSPTAYFIRIGNLVSVFIRSIEVPVDAAALYRITGLPYNISPNCRGAATLSECRGASFRYADTIHTNNISGPYATFSSGNNYISTTFTRTSEDFGGYVYYATASGSNFPHVQANYFTDDTTLITEQ